MSSYVRNMKVWWYKMFLIVIFHPLKSLRTFKKSTNFLHFWCQKFVGWIFWSLQLLKKIIFTYQIKCFHMEYDHISSPKIYCKFNYRLFWYPQLFTFLSEFMNVDGQTFSSRSSSGWVLMDLKVLPSKSMSSQEHFSYLSCFHIFNTSRDNYKSFKKFTPVVSYIQMHHM